MMFSGLISRCTISAACAADNAEAIWIVMSIASVKGICARVRRCLSVSPSMNSVAMKCAKSVWPTSDVRMIQGRNGGGFLAEPTHAIGVVGKGNRQKLQGDLTSQASVLGQINFGHPSGTNARKNRVGADYVTGRQFRASTGNHRSSDLSCGRLKQA